MKNKIVVSALFMLLITAGISSQANAAPWRGGYGYRHACYGPRIGVRVWAPPVRVYVPTVRIVAPAPIVYGGYYGGGYARGYTRGGYCGPRYYARGGGYRNCGPRRYR